MPAAHSQLVQGTCVCLDTQADAGRAGVMESMGPRDPGCGRSRGRVVSRLFLHLFSKCRPQTKTLQNET